MTKKNRYKKISGIYAITANKAPNLNLIEHAIIRHNIGILQYRRKTTNAQLKLSEAKKIQQLCLRHNTLFIINDDINLAEKIKADGVHLGKNDASITQARAQLGESAIIGVSCYDDINLAKHMQDLGANYAAFGALFPSNTKPDAPHCALDAVTQAKQALSIPIVGIGGIDFENQSQAFDAGCDAVAMISALWTPTSQLTDSLQDNIART